MSKRTWLRWLPVFWTSLASILLIAWAVFAESQVQGPVSSPGTLSFQAYLPSHYCIYCQIDDDLTNKESILAKMRLFPQITCRVQGADYLFGSKIVDKINLTPEQPINEEVVVNDA